MACGTDGRADEWRIRTGRHVRDSAESTSGSGSKLGADFSGAYSPMRRMSRGVFNAIACANGQIVRWPDSPRALIESGVRSELITFAAQHTLGERLWVRRSRSE